MPTVKVTRDDRWVCGDADTIRRIAWEQIRNLTGNSKDNMAWYCVDPNTGVLNPKYEGKIAKANITVTVEWEESDE